MKSFVEFITENKAMKDISKMSTAYLKKIYAENMRKSRNPEHVSRLTAIHDELRKRHEAVWGDINYDSALPKSARNFHPSHLADPKKHSDYTADELDDAHHHFWDLHKKSNGAPTEEMKNINVKMYRAAMLHPGEDGAKAKEYNEKMRDVFKNLPKEHPLRVSDFPSK